MSVDVERLANMFKRGDSPRPTPSIDPVTAQVINAGAQTICYEMVTHMKLTATTPFLNQTQEFNANILDADGRAAFVFGGIPTFVLMPTIPARFALEFFGKDGLHEGDILVFNDPYHGGGHLPDYTMFAPVFYEGKLVFIAAIETHHTDTGGSVPGGYNMQALDIWAEGIRWPPVKLYEGGVERKDIMYMLRLNNRVPTFAGDLRAQIGAVRVGVKRLEEMLKKYGNDMMQAAVEYIIQYSERRFAEEVSKWPDGEYEADGYLEHDGVGNKDIYMRVKVAVKGGKLTIDYTGSDDRPELQTRCTYASTLGNVMVQIATMLDDPHIPKNEGFLENIDLIVPRGCIFNAEDGKPVAVGTHQPGSQACTILCKALAKVAPRRCAPQPQGHNMAWVIVGVNPYNGQFFVDPSVDVWGSDVNAVYGQDAWGGFVTAYSNILPAETELTEPILPNRIWSREYTTDTGGAGQWRGLCATRVDKQVLGPGHITFGFYATKYGMPGMAGGKDGGLQKAILRADGPNEISIDEVADRVPLEAGDMLVRQYAGGGGWGNPLEREPEMVRNDVLDEFVSREAAEAEYGVIVKGDIENYSLEVDYQATEALRKKMLESPK